MNNKAEKSKVKIESSNLSKTARKTKAKKPLADHDNVKDSAKKNFGKNYDDKHILPVKDKKLTKPGESAMFNSEVNNNNSALNGSLELNTELNDAPKSNEGNSDSSEKLVYFAIEGKWRKVGPRFFRK